jgi:hypothetical protein
LSCGPGPSTANQSGWMGCMHSGTVDCKSVRLDGMYAQRNSRLPGIKIAS